MYTIKNADEQRFRRTGFNSVANGLIGTGDLPSAGPKPDTVREPVRSRAGGCVEAELAGLVVSGATTLAGMIVTDAWSAVKDRVGAMFGRGGRGREESVLRELEELRGDLTAARARGDEAGAAEVVADVERLLRRRLSRLLAEQPSLAGEVRELLTEVGNTVNNGTMVVGDQTQVSNVYNYYGVGPAVGRPSPQPPVPQVARLPRITLRPLRHYQNNDHLLSRMDGIWAACRADGVPTVMYLTGVPGIGTSALVRRWLHSHQDELTGPQVAAPLGRDAWGNLPEQAEILERWFRELGVPAQDVPADPQDRTEYFRTVVRDLPIVVLLEDVVLASQVRQLLPGSAESVVLITSHSLLPELVGTFDAEPLPMGPLSQEHSRRLLVSVGRMGGDAEGYASELDLITDVCQGLPLALCVAGAQLAVGHPGRIRELAAELSDARTRLGAFDVGDELSVSVALGHGYRNLVPDTAHLYRCLGLHPAAEFEADVVRALLPDWDTTARHEALKQLTAANLIEPSAHNQTGDNQTGDNRAGVNGHRMRHTLIHDHALACARTDEPAEVREEVLDRIVEHYVEVAERAEAALSSRYRYDPAGAYVAYAPTGPVDAPAVIAGLERRRESLRNAVRLAHDTGRHDGAWRMAQGLHTFYLRCGLHSDWITTHELACESALECGDLAALARMRFELGFAHLDRWSTVQGDPRAAREQFERALELVGSAGGQPTEDRRRTESSVLEGLGLAERKLGNASQALAHYTSALAALDGIDHPRGRALLALHRGPVYTDLGRHDEAVRELLSARAQFAALPVRDRYNEARALTRYAEDRRAAGAPESAVRALDEAIEIMTVNGPPYQRAGILLLRGDLRHEQGDRVRATEDWSAAGGLFREGHSLRAREADERLADAAE